MTDTTVREERTDLALAAVFLLVVVAGVTDLVLDQPTTWWSLHVVVEVAVVALGLGLAIALWARWRATARSLEAAERSAEERRLERDAWKERASRALEGLGAALDAQFRAWELTPAEAEVALGLLKGQTHKQLARASGRSERTVRQHAVAVYRKARVSGRAELAAFFLEDIALPGT